LHISNHVITIMAVCCWLRLQDYGGFWVRFHQRFQDFSQDSNQKRTRFQGVGSPSATSVPRIEWKKWALSLIPRPHPLTRRRARGGHETNVLRSARRVVMMCIQNKLHSGYTIQWYSVNKRESTREIPGEITKTR